MNILVQFYCIYLIEEAMRNMMKTKGSRYIQNIPYVIWFARTGENIRSFDSHINYI